MIRQVLILLLIFVLQIPKAQTIDLSSADAFFDITTDIKSGKEISKEQWKRFEKSSVYRRFASRDNPFLINTIKESIELVFRKTEKNKYQIDSLLSISEEKIKQDRKWLLKKLIVENYININKHYNEIKSFRKEYDFESLIYKSRKKLSAFLIHPIDSLTNLKPIHFFMLNADAKNEENAIIVDLNSFYNLTDKQRVELITHEYFHNYRERFENHKFNYKSDLNYMIDMIQNEGIADMIDKAIGYEEFYSREPFTYLSPLMVKSYNSAENDLERLHKVVLQYSLNKITKDWMVDSLLNIVKFNGHPIGFYMANQIVKAGYRKQMIKTFYEPLEFYKLYNKAAKKRNLFLLSDEFMEFVFKR